MSQVSYLESLLKQALQPSHLEVLNESHQHSVPAGSETHLAIIAVAECFVGQSLLQRHRKIYEILQSDPAQVKTPSAQTLPAGLHALRLQLYTPEEYAAQDSIPSAPTCRGGFHAS
ncbi:MAG: BolA/IbaG family iron-sulfur metabolism protein [Legionellaceae bacterium]|nr:BolA/IbaG family iron-sulfur metabolism protein [Legionellaceae bacterium]